jgi:DNA-directed RNA polymerase sigma subunit (sigma70/sigma32)
MTTRQKLKANQRRVLSAWERLGGEPTTREIAKEAGMNVNGVSNMLESCHSLLGLVRCEPECGGSGQKWRAAV